MEKYYIVSFLDEDQPNAFINYADLVMFRTYEKAVKFILDNIYDMMVADDDDEIEIISYDAPFATGNYTQSNLRKTFIYNKDTWLNDADVIGMGDGLVKYKIYEKSPKD